MLKYRGKYRVVYEMDMKTLKPCEFTFIPCRIKKGSNIYRNDNNELFAYIPSIVIGSRLAKDYPGIFRIHLQSELESILAFDECHMEQAAKILKAYTSGKNIAPTSKRNLRFQEFGGQAACM